MSTSSSSSQTDFIRFDLSQRVEHLLMLMSFTLLCLTGIPQRYASTGWATWMIEAFGGIDRIRFIHRATAFVFCLEGVYHTLYIAWSWIVKRQPLSMMPTLKDAKDILHQMRYFVGLSPTEPRYDRFDYRQKFEYYGVVWGGIVMILTGLIMIFPSFTAQFVPGEIIPAAKEAHGGEAMLAFLVIVTWHLYGAHLNPHRFPADTTIFTGRISHKRMEEEHPLELERSAKAPGESTPADQ